MPIQTYKPPGMLINLVSIDTDTNSVVITYNSETEITHSKYSVADVENFRLQMLEQFINIDVNSFSEFIAENIANGDFIIIFDGLIGESTVDYSLAVDYSLVEETITASGNL